MDNGYLVHYGVKGMHWGVRRYQNYDGSYTQRGLKRYETSASKYSEKKDAYKNIKSGFKSGTASKLDVNKARNEMKDAKRQRNKDYKQLKLDNRADQGKLLYKQGKTITDNNKKAEDLASTVAFVTGVTGLALMSKGKGLEYVNQSAAEHLKDLGFHVALGGAAVNGYIAMWNEYQNRKLRAYYAH